MGEAHDGGSASKEYSLSQPAADSSLREGAYPPFKSCFSSASRFSASMGERMFTSVMRSFFRTVSPPMSPRDTWPVGADDSAADRKSVV